MKAMWNGQIVAESDQTVVVEGNHYFPQSAIKQEFFTETEKHSTCPWKGVASYYTVAVDGKTNADSAWFYPDPKADASHIKDHVAFWRGIEVTE